MPSASFHQENGTEEDSLFEKISTVIGPNITLAQKVTEYIDSYVGYMLIVIYN